MQIYRLGDEGPEILDIQHRLHELGFLLSVSEPSLYGEQTQSAVRAFQAQRSLRVDGIVGPDTWGQLIEAGFRLGDRTLYVHAPLLRGDDVRALQRKLDALGFDPGKQDGMYGPATDAALREFQRNVGEDVDGVVGLHTIATLERMRPLDDVPGRGVVRETEELRESRGRLDGHVIAIDPGLAPSDGTPDVHLTLARAVALELTRLGAKPEILREGSESPSPSARAAMANTMDAIGLRVVAPRREPAGIERADLLLLRLAGDAFPRRPPPRGAHPAGVGERAAAPWPCAGSDGVDVAGDEDACSAGRSVGPRERGGGRGASGTRHDDARRSRHRRGRAAVLRGLAAASEQRKHQPEHDAEHGRAHAALPLRQESLGVPIGLGGHGG